LGSISKYSSIYPIKINVRKYSLVLEHIYKSYNEVPYVGIYENSIKITVSRSKVEPQNQHTESRKDHHRTVVNTIIISKHFLLFQHDAHRYKKTIKIPTVATTCFGSCGNHNQGAISCLAKTTVKTTVMILCARL